MYGLKILFARPHKRASTSISYKKDDEKLIPFCFVFCFCFFFQKVVSAIFLPLQSIINHILSE